MPDPAERADRLDAHLNAGSVASSDNLESFASRVVHNAGMRPDESTAPSEEQRARICERVLASAETRPREESSMQVQTFSANGSTLKPMGIAGAGQPPISGFSMLMTAALVALIGVAAFGVFRGSLDFLPGHAGPEPTMAAGLAYSPVASPSAGHSCDRSGWVSVFEGDGPSILRDTPHATLIDGTLAWHCGSDTEELATGVRSASGVYWPGVIAFVTENDEVRLLNIASGTSLDLDGDWLLNDNGEIDFLRVFAWSGGPEPWVYAQANADRTDWRIIDVRSMNSLLLSNTLSEPLSVPSYPDPGLITGTDVGIVTWRPDSTSMVSTTPIPDGRVFAPDQRALVLPGSIDDYRWIDITEFRQETTMRGTEASQRSSVSLDGSLIAYATTSGTSAPVIRIEEAVSGDRVANVPVDGIDEHTAFMLAGKEPRLVYANGETVRIYEFTQGDVRQTAELPNPKVRWFYPTANLDIVLMVGSSQGATPLNVASGEAGDSYVYVPSVVKQVFGSYEMPANIVRVKTESPGGRPAVIQLVHASTGEIEVETEPIDVNPTQIVSFDTWLRNGGELAVVPIGYNRAVVLDATSGETWEIEAPVDDDRLWHFFPSYDGCFVTAYPEPPAGTTEYEDGYVAPLEPGASWVPIDEGSVTSDTMGIGTPVPDSP